MDHSHWRERKLYPTMGILTIACLLYLNFNDNIDFSSFPIILWHQLPKMRFVGVNNTRFVIINDDGDQGVKPAPRRGLPEPEMREVYVNGWNSYWLMEESFWGGASRGRVSMMLKRGSQMGLTVCRTWAFSDGDGPSALQVQPGVFNEKVFKALDYVIVEARRHQIRLILSLVNNLNAYGGKAQYVRWAQEAGVNVSSSTDSFFSNAIVKDYYKAYVKAVITRKNSISGVKYSEEPSIFAWELINEPRCNSNSSAPDLQAWIAEMAAFIKSLDRKHLVTVGLEGFYSPKTTENAMANPGAWAALLGSDFIQNSATNDIDFASVHAYPHSWIPGADLEAKVNYLSRWMTAHINDGQNVLKKPVLFTEVGFPLRNEEEGLYGRDIFLNTVYDKIYESAKKREAGAGALIWQLLLEGMEEYGDRFSFVAWEHPSTYKLIIEQSCRLRNISVNGLTDRELNAEDICSR